MADKKVRQTIDIGHQRVFNTEGDSQNILTALKLLTCGTVMIFSVAFFGLLLLASALSPDWETAFNLTFLGMFLVFLAVLFYFPGRAGFHMAEGGITMILAIVEVYVMRIEFLRDMFAQELDERREEVRVVPVSSGANNNRLIDQVLPKPDMTRPDIKGLVTEFVLPNKRKITEARFKEFIRGATQGAKGFQRETWVENGAYQRFEYDGMMAQLEQLGIIVNRTGGKTGECTLNDYEEICIMLNFKRRVDHQFYEDIDDDPVPQ